MHSTVSLIARLEADYPHLTFVKGGDFHWSYDEQTVTYTLAGSTAELLHEVAHAVLGHARYQRDIELLGLERDAWTQAQTVLGPRYDITVSDNDIQDALDTYRDWLHARSTCPECRATGLETAKHRYQCPACRTQWHVNEARVCELRRHTIQK